MTTMTRSLTTDVAQTKHRTVTRAALVAVFWIVAALLVAIAHQKMYTASPVVAVAVEAVAIVATAGAYIRIAAPQSTLDHALFAGTVWVLLGIATEIAMTARSGHQWFALLGSPANGGLRCVLLITWVIAPALFVRHRE
jgi:uncharacterized membrane protein YGL010W